MSRDHFASFAADYDPRYAKELGNFRIEPISRAVRWPAIGFVFTIPKALRVFLRYDQRLFGRISRLIYSPIVEFYSMSFWSRHLVEAARRRCSRQPGGP